jgi:hypothetical protein
MVYPAAYNRLLLAALPVHRYLKIVLPACLLNYTTLPEQAANFLDTMDTDNSNDVLVREQATNCRLLFLSTTARHMYIDCSL